MPEVCVGVVKALIGIHQKNPCQHASHLKMLEEVEELKPVFWNFESDKQKRIDCVRVDGASDEGPSHEEVQFYWTERHIEKERLPHLLQHAIVDPAISTGLSCKMGAFL